MGLTPEPLNAFFSPSSLGFDPALPLDATNGINAGQNVPPELIPPIPQAQPPAPIEPPAPVAPVAPPAVAEPEPEPEPVPPQPPETEEHRQWRIAYEQYKAQNDNAVTQALAGRRKATRERLRPILQEIADNLSDMYTEAAAKLGPPPKLILKDKGSSEFYPPPKLIAINYEQEWDRHKYAIRHEFEHWAHECWYQQFAPNDFEDTIKQAAARDWEAFKIRYQDNMDALRRENIHHTLAREMFGLHFFQLTTSQQHATLGLADAIGEFSLGEYGNGHSVKYYNDLFNRGGSDLYCETLANIPAINSEMGIDYTQSVLPNMYRFFENIGVL